MVLKILHILAQSLAFLKPIESLILDISEALHLSDTVDTNLLAISSRW